VTALATATEEMQGLHSTVHLFTAILSSRALDALTLDLFMVRQPHRRNQQLHLGSTCAYWLVFTPAVNARVILAGEKQMVAFLGALAASHPSGPTGSGANAIGCGEA
jgi:hypothetical protein